MKNSLNTSVNRIICMITIIILIVNTSIPILADEIDTGRIEVDPYQQVIDNLNTEYGTNVHFPTPEECELLNITRKNITISTEEFELILRQDIEANLIANYEAELLARNVASDRLDETGYGQCSVCDDHQRSSYTVTRTKDVPGATVHMTATVNNNNNFWQYGSISDVWTTWQSGVNSTPIFQAQTYTYSFRDTRRTCFVELNGYTVNTQLVIIDSNAYRSVEFYAGSGM